MALMKTSLTFSSRYNIFQLIFHILSYFHFNNLNKTNFTYKKLSPDFEAEFYKGAGIEDKYTSEILAYEQIIPKMKSLSNSPR